MKKKTSAREELKKQIDECLNYIKAIKTGFNEASDAGLADYYIYEKRAAEQKYIYLLGLYSKMT